jgi:hypothetical protein
MEVSDKISAIDLPAAILDRMVLNRLTALLGIDFENVES